MKLLLVIILAILMILPYLACDQQASLQDVVDRALTQTSQVQSYRSAGNSTTYTDTITYEGSSEVAYAAPDRWHLSETVIVDGGENVTTTTSSNGASVTVTAGGGWFETIIVGDKGYVRNSREPWQVCKVYNSPLPWPAPSTGTCFVSIQTLENKLELLNYLVELEKLPDEEIGGVNCSHYRGRVDQDSYVDMLRKRQEEEYRQIPPENLELMRRREIVVELWIDGDDYIRQQGTEFRVPEPLSEGKWVSGFGITQYFDFNEPICIEPPEIEPE